MCRKRSSHPRIAAALCVLMPLAWLGPLMAQSPAISTDIHALAYHPRANVERASTTAPAAGRDDARVYTLDQLLDIALNTSPDARQAQEKYVQAMLATKLVRSEYSPNVDVKVVGGLQETPLAIPQTVSPRGYFISNTRELVPTLELKWLLFDFGRRSGQLAEANSNALAAESGALGTQEKLVFDVTKAFFELVAAQGHVRAIGKTVTSAELTEQAVNDQRQHGRATVVDVAEAARHTATVRLAMVKAEGAQRTAFASLVAAVGLPSDAVFDIAADAADASTAHVDDDVGKLIEKAMDTRPDIEAAKNKVDAAQAKIRTAHAAYRPTISMTAQVFQNAGEISSDGSPYSSIDRTGGAIFFALELPIWDGGMRSTNVALAVSQESEAEDEFTAAKNTASKQVVQAYNEFKTSQEEQVQALALRQAADTAYQASLASYKRGLTTLTDLTSSEANLAQAQAEQEDADADVHIARAALALSMGINTPAQRTPTHP